MWGSWWSSMQRHSECWWVCYTGDQSTTGCVWSAVVVIWTDHRFVCCCLWSGSHGSWLGSIHTAAQGLPPSMQGWIVAPPHPSPARLCSWPRLPDIYLRGQGCQCSISYISHCVPVAHRKCRPNTFSICLNVMCKCVLFLFSHLIKCNLFHKFV